MARDKNIRVRKNTAANAASSNPVLDAGELGFETDTRRMKVGDGATAWTSLPEVGSGTYAALGDSEKARGVITISWDDGWAAQWANLWPLLRDRYPRQRHTFAIVSTFLDTTNFITSAQVATMAAAGHEIACHSKTHPTIKDQAVATRVVEYDDGRPVLEALIGKPVTTFVYPLGNNGRNTTTDRELWTRYDRIVNAGASWNGSMVPLDQRVGMFQVPRTPVWDSATHKRVLAMIRTVAHQPVVLSLYAHRPGGVTPDMSVAELIEGLDLIESLGIPVLTIADAFPSGSLLVNPSAEAGDMTGWDAVSTGVGQVAQAVTDTPLTGISGTKAFRLDCTTDSNFIYIYQDLPVQEGLSYTFSGQTRAVYTSGAGYGRLRLQFNDQFGVGIGSVYGSTDIAATTYGHLSVTAVAPAGARTVRADCIVLNKTGSAWFDHLHFGATRDGALG